MLKKLSKRYLKEAVREILLSVPDSGRDAFTSIECGQRVLEEYGDFNADDFSETWTDARRQMRLTAPSP
jgi:hypothetical protein